MMLMQDAHPHHAQMLKVKTNNMHVVYLYYIISVFNYTVIIIRLDYFGSPLEQNALHSIIPVVFKEWEVSLEVYPTGIIDDWANILHIGLGGNLDKYGDRSPSIWFFPNTTRLAISSDVNSQKRVVVSHTGQSEKSGRQKSFQ